jgi:hypothetical protein
LTGCCAQLHDAACVKSASRGSLPLAFFPPGETAKGLFAKQPLIKARSKIMKILLFVVSTLVCLSFSPAVQAVVPPPDGGYPNFTTAEGTNALLHLTTGAGNTAVGWFSLKSVTTGSFNTGIGAGALVLNAGDENTGIGTAALLLNTASGNTAVGSRALLNNTTGGTLANIQGIDVGPNVAIGQQALENNTVASANTAVGYQALHSFATGPAGVEELGLCTAVGFQALAHSTGSGSTNSAFGYQALLNNTDGGGNTAIGLGSLHANTTGNANVASGNNALSNNTIGEDNTATGVSALIANADGNDNTAVGFGALPSNMTGDANTVVGSFAGGGVTGNGNTILGSAAGGGIGTADNVICIGSSLPGASVTGSCYINNIWMQPGGSQAVYVNAEGKLGALVSSRRFKDAIKPLGQASEALFALTPVSFRYKKEIDCAGTPQLGLVAEDVEKVSPDLVIRDKEGKPYSVRYDQVNAMLLNEFLKEHKTVQEQGATIARLEKQIETLTAGLQKVNAQLATAGPSLADSN